MKKTLALILSMLLVLALCVSAGAEELPWTIKESTGLIKLASGTNVAAALRMAKLLGKGKTVVTVLPDTGERYFSTELFDF